jgi:hypothetical protein
MSDPALIEETAQFGEGGRLSGILTLPIQPAPDQGKLPVFVFLNSGFLHRVGPHRLYVRLARELSRSGFHSLRIDLSGKGDSPPRPGLNVRQTEAADYGDIVSGLESRLGRVNIVLAGLCSGADDAIRLTPTDSRIVGLLLLDPICFPDRGYKTRAFVAEYMQPARYIAWLRNWLESPQSRRPKAKVEVDQLAIRDAPTLEELRLAFDSIRERNGRVLSVFTRWATRYYNQAGQLERVLDLRDYQRHCTELFWRDVEHTYTLDVQRRRLMEVARNWATGYVRW